MGSMISGALFRTDIFLRMEQLLQEWVSGLILAVKQYAVLPFLCHVLQLADCRIALCLQPIQTRNGLLR